MKLTYLFIVLVVFLTPDCSNNLTTEQKKELEGRWVEAYKHISSAHVDTLFTAILELEDKNFSSVLYRDSGQQMEYDTSFSGRYSVSKDSLEFILDNFREKFFWRIANNKLYLSAVYSIDSKGNKFGDFRSVLWCCDLKKNGRLIKN